MRGALGFCLIFVAVAACAAATPPEVGRRAALRLRADLAPTLRLSTPWRGEILPKVAMPAPPAEQAVEAGKLLSEPTQPELVLPAAPSTPQPAAKTVDSQVIAAAEFVPPNQPPQAQRALGMPAAGLPNLQYVYLAAHDEPEPTSDDLADPLTRLLGQQPDEYIRPIGDLGADIAFKPGPLPEKYDRLAAEKFARAGEVVAAFGSDRPWPPFTYAYVAPGLCHRPLYFEEPNVERYGYQLGCVQSVVSGAHFFATVPFLPYKMVLSRPHDCRYTLGQYRPGDYTPFQRTRFVWDTKAAAAQMGVVVGLVFLIP